MTVGADRSMTTRSAAIVPAGPVAARASVTLFGARLRFTVPVEQPVTTMVYAAGPPAGALSVHDAAVPWRRKSDVVRPVTAPAKVTP